MIKNPPKSSGDVCTGILLEGRSFLRIAINSPYLREGDDPLDFAAKHTAGRLMPDDILIIRSEALAICQGRFYPRNSPDFGKFTSLMSKFAGLSASAEAFGDPRLLEIAMRECGALRVTLASLSCPLERLFHGHDWFYRLSGEESRAIFRLSDNKRSTYRRCVILRPDNPESLAVAISEELGCRTMVADLRPESGTAKILASSESVLSKEEIEQILSGAPMQVNGRRVPLGIVRAEKTSVI
ncbi:MAG: hypothetical protein ACI3YK_03205 [Eubacteriales bacterium]